MQVDGNGPQQRTNRIRKPHSDTHGRVWTTPLPIPKLRVSGSSQPGGTSITKPYTAHGVGLLFATVGLAVAAFAISRHRWRTIRMPAAFELRHQLVSDRLLGCSDRAADTQPRVPIQRYAAPEGTALGSFSIAPFSPLLPT